MIIIIGAFLTSALFASGALVQSHPLVATILGGLCAMMLSALFSRALTAPIGYTTRSSTYTLLALCAQFQMLQQQLGTPSSEIPMWVADSKGLLPMAGVFLATLQGKQSIVIEGVLDVKT